MIVSDITKILKVTKRQIFYWDEKGMKLSRKKTPSRAWRKFSIIDILGFAIIKKLRTFGLGLNQCDMVFDWLRTNLYETPVFLYHIAEGDSVILSINVNTGETLHYYGSELSTYNTLAADIQQTTEPIIMLPLNPIFKAVFEQIYREDFRVEFTNDRLGGNNKIIFYIDRDRLELKLSKEIRQIFPEVKIFKSCKGDSVEETIMFTEENST